MLCLDTEFSLAYCSSSPFLLCLAKMTPRAVTFGPLLLNVAATTTTLLVVGTTNRTLCVSSSASCSAIQQIQCVQTRPPVPTLALAGALTRRTSVEFTPTEACTSHALRIHRVVKQCCYMGRKACSRSVQQTYCR